MDLSFLDAVGGPRIVIGVVVTVLALMVVARLLKSGKVESHTQRKQCPCGWVGNVSTFKPRCPKCGQAMS